jgi:hypothetical protein
MVWIERAFEQGRLDDAAQPGRVQRDLLQPWVTTRTREGPVNVLFPQPAKAQDAV